MTIFEGITAEAVQTPRLRANVLRRPATSATRRTVVFVHGNVSSSLFWQPLMLALPADVDAYAIDLRGFGDSETLPVDATRGLRDFSDDVRGVIEELRLGGWDLDVDLVGWSMGAGVVLQYALDHPVRTLTLQAPVSPYGFGGTRGTDGERLTSDDAGVGAGGANPDFVARLEAGDTSDEAPTSPRSVYRSSYVAAGFETEHEDVWVTSMLTTRTGPDNYPGDSVVSENWPGFAAGTRGVLNTMAPKYFDASGIVDLETKPPILWVHGSADAIVGDATFFDINQLGAAGVIPGWPGADVAPPSPMVAQTRAVLEAYAAAGGTYREVLLEGAGHSPHLERQAEFLAALTEHLA
ncbi:alpha/beta fold hydrolase [Occultella kanbiaonis]|uniref:alpha/beta fold hydrolase n=1 Tax=Occultella kanbiaonis TaxID=2675754 RepID=UPI0012B950DE|nr:alpha/beta hydrolase [Occultella kanbiaonis]